MAWKQSDLYAAILCKAPFFDLRRSNQASYRLLIHYKAGPYDIIDHIVQISQIDSTVIYYFSIFLVRGGGGVLVVLSLSIIEIH